MSGGKITDTMAEALKPHRDGWKKYRLDPETRQRAITWEFMRRLRSYVRLQRFRLSLQNHGLGLRFRAALDHVQYLVCTIYACLSMLGLQRVKFVITDLSKCCEAVVQNSGNCCFDS